MAHNKRNSLSIDALEKQIPQNLSEEDLKEIRVSGGGNVCDQCDERLWAPLLIAKSGLSMRS